jgi:hypothetical protein
MTFAVSEWGHADASTPQRDESGCCATLGSGASPHIYCSAGQQPASKVKLRFEKSHETYEDAEVALRKVRECTGVPSPFFA